MNQNVVVRAEEVESRTEITLHHRGTGAAEEVQGDTADDARQGGLLSAVVGRDADGDVETADSRRASRPDLQGQIAQARSAGRLSTAAAGQTDRDVEATECGRGARSKLYCDIAEAHRASRGSCLRGAEDEIENSSQRRRGAWPKLQVQPKKGRQCCRRGAVTERPAEGERGEVGHGARAGADRDGAAEQGIASVCGSAGPDRDGQGGQVACAPVAVAQAERGKARRVGRWGGGECSCGKRAGDQRAERRVTFSPNPTHRNPVTRTCLC
ncbi:hypothetical protein [Mycobacterium sp. EPa45]|uniref:hypothetical protein n=1 Tax=Mycobacterium sp. EPa45 TaxID=1545728 RepID=UPI00118746A8